jgi:Zn-dependent protease
MNTSVKKNQVRIASFFGVPITFDFSWFLVVIFLAWILAEGYFPKEYKGWDTFHYWLVSIVTSIFFFVSVLIHEFAHSIVAKKFNYNVKGIKLFIFGGVSEITTEPKSPKEEFWISAAGPIASILLGIIFYFTATAFPKNSYVFAFAHYLGWINIILGVFNLFPGFPLDGGRIFRSIIWKVKKDYGVATHWAGVSGRFFGFALIFIGFLEIMAGFVTDGIWVAFIGWFLESAAFAQLQQQELHKLLKGNKVKDALSRNYVLVPDDITISQFLETKEFYGNKNFFFAENSGQITGVFTFSDLVKAPKSDWDKSEIKDIITPISNVKTTKPNTPLITALKMMDKRGFNQIPVMENGKLLGVLSRKSLVTFLGGLNKE